jgi:hypothetical protein
MRRGSKNSLIVVALFGQLSFGHTAVESLEAGDLQSKHETFLSVSTPEPSDLMPVALSPIIREGAIVGAVAIYNDPRTARPGDYFELYNRGGDLLAVAWFDRFGIERTAVDRGLLEAPHKLQGVFIILVEGDSV